MDLFEGSGDPSSRASSTLPPLPLQPQPWTGSWAGAEAGYGPSPIYLSLRRRSSQECPRCACACYPPPAWPEASPPLTAVTPLDLVKCKMQVRTGRLCCALRFDACITTF
ncbi:hypothetical protein BHE74_00053931 [Ensete ventricosum]|nr:hypothetical protein BHE74_00053931 [Ensete ventricosum]